MQKEALMEYPKMKFVLQGFAQVREFRVFAFEGVASDWTRTTFTVRADPALAQRYGIRLQELPLVCRAALERRHEGDEQRAFTLTEEDLCLHANGASAREEAAKQEKEPRRPIIGRAGVTRRLP